MDISAAFDSTGLHLRTVEEGAQGVPMRWSWAVAPTATGTTALLGLQQVTVAGQALKSPASLWFPLLADEWLQPGWVAPFWEWDGHDPARTADGWWALRGWWLGGAHEALWRAHFVGQANTGRWAIHRDAYRFAQLRLPGEICAEPTRRALWRETHTALQRLGTWEWQLAPATRRVGGWRWHGWRWRLVLQLADGRRTNDVRWLGTWELDGHLADLTLAAMRYRGLGRIEQAVALAPDQTSATAWSTCETLPGWAKEAPAVSPVIPQSQAKMDRGDALAHRAAAWIAYPARGAGGPFFDSQWNPRAMHVAFPERQGNHRAASELYPGDAQVSATAEEWFPLTSAFVGTPQVHLVLSAPAGEGVGPHFWRTRWAEWDRHLRRELATELGFAPLPEVVPTVGELWDFWGNNGRSYLPFLRQLAERSTAWAEAGVRAVVTHNSGNLDARSVSRGWDGLSKDDLVPNGCLGNCQPYDWRAIPAIVPQWQATYRRLREQGLRYYIWLTAMVVDGAPFVRRVGPGEEHWTLNSPDGRPNDTYSAAMRKPNLRSARTREVWTQTLAELCAEGGYDGFWVDSFQNLSMSQLAWSDGSGAPTQREWWEWLAEQSRHGVDFMAESYACPGLSCSIEVTDWEHDLWYFHQTCKWHRGGGWRHYSPAQRTTLCFRAMSAKGWTAPEMLSEPERRPLELAEVMPQFDRLAHEYLAALPDLGRAFCLAQPGPGTLWLLGDDNDADAAATWSHGIWFPWATTAVPVGVAARPILADPAVPPVAEALAEHTYRVAAPDLAAAFGILRPPALP